MKKWLLSLGLMALLAPSTLAFRPSGWVYNEYPWAYDSASGDWYWFNTADTQWVANMANGQWATLPHSALASGWVYYDWAYAYAQDNGAWHWINTADTQWVVNMRTGGWSPFGHLFLTPVPLGMVSIPGGTNAGTDPDFGAYSLTVNTFYMDQHEVTKAKWDAVYTWALANGYSFDNAGSGKAANHPVYSINWYDAVKWCNARSEKEGRPAVYTVDGAVYKSGQRDPVAQSSAAGYRLPNSAEWEYAARGGVTNRRFPWGYTIQHERANYYSSSTYSYDTSPTREYHPTYDTGGFPYTSPAGAFAPNNYGLYDMMGNVFEWCFDWHPSHVGTYRELRGGSWTYSASYCRMAYRNYDAPDYASNVIGFRAVLPSR